MTSQQYIVLFTILYQFFTLCLSFVTQNCPRINVHLHFTGANTWVLSKCSTFCPCANVRCCTSKPIEANGFCGWNANSCAGATLSLIERYRYLLEFLAGTHICKVQVQVCVWSQFCSYMSRALAQNFHFVRTGGYNPLDQSEVLELRVVPKTSTPRT